MKNLFILLSILLLSLFALSFSQQAPDTPVTSGSRTANIVSFDAGSLIIDMGSYQNEDTTVLATQVPSYYTSFTGYSCGSAYDGLTQYVNSSYAGLFNMYSYGLAVRLLYANIPVYWVISSNKVQNTVDISVNSRRIHPARAPNNGVNWGGSYNVSGTYSFTNGPFVIRASDASNALNVLSNVISAYGPQGGRFESLVIYQSNTAFNADVRHKMTFHPYAFVSTLAGPWCTWSALAMVLMNAGLVDGVHFQLILNSTQVTAFSTQTCGTIFMEPHYTFDDSGCPGCGDTPSYFTPLTQFIQSGGNFWVQCAGIASYENSRWPSLYVPPGGSTQQGAFISKYGIQGLGNPYGLFQITGSSNTFPSNNWESGVNTEALTYLNPDIPISQFSGVIANQSGTITSFFLRNDPNTALNTDAQLFANNGYSIIEHPTTNSNTWSSMAASAKNQGPCVGCCPGSNGYVYSQKQNVANACTYNSTIPGDGRHAITSAGARLSSNSGTLLGGNVWYLGTHTVFVDTQNGNQKNSNYPSGYYEYPSLYNGRRMLMNAVLTPAVRPQNCDQNFCSQDVDCTSQYDACHRCAPNATCINLAPTNCAAGVNFATCTCNSPSPSITPSNSLSSSKSLSSSASKSLSGSTSHTPAASQSQSLSNTPPPSTSMSSSKSMSPSGTAAPSTSLSSSKSTSLSATSTISTTNTASRSAGASLSSSPSTSLSSSKSTSLSASSTISTTNTASRSAGASLSSSPSTSLSSSKSTSLSATSTISTTNTASRSAGASLSSTPSTSLSSTASTSFIPSPSASQTPSSSSSSSSSPSPSNSFVVVAGGGGGGSNAGAIAGGVIGGVAALAAAGAIAAAVAGVIAYKKRAGAPVDTGAFSNSMAFQDVKNNNIYEGSHLNCENPIYQQ